MHLQLNRTHCILIDDTRQEKPFQIKHYVGFSGWSKSPGHCISTSFDEETLGMGFIALSLQFFFQGSFSVIVSHVVVFHLLPTNA